jgi:DNA primase large subunit
MTAKALPRLDEDSRLIPVLDNLSQGFLAGVPSEWSGADGSTSGDTIRAEMVDEISRNHYPMCMRHLHDALRRDRHLKHYARLQYGLFLKVRSFWTVRRRAHRYSGLGSIHRGGACVLATVVQ